jgi:hypothetical protein
MQAGAARYAHAVVCPTSRYIVRWVAVLRWLHAPSQHPAAQSALSLHWTSKWQRLPMQTPMPHARQRTWQHWGSMGTLLLLAAPHHLHEQARGCGARAPAGARARSALWPPPGAIPAGLQPYAPSTGEDVQTLLAWVTCACAVLRQPSGRT